MLQSSRGALKVLSAGGFLALTCFTPGAEAAFYNGPYLQQVSQTSITLMWETDATSTGQVKYGTTTSLGSTASDGVSGTIHQVKLANLAPATTYYYSVTESGGSTTAVSHFTTSPRVGTDFTFAVYGDSRSDATAHNLVSQAILSKKPALVIATGDYAQYTGFLREWHGQFFVPAADMLLNTPIVPAVGNHDSEVGHIKSPIWTYFPRPGTTNYYSFDYGDIHFVLVDSNLPYNSTSSQYAWLKTDLASTTKPIILVAHHFPVYSSGQHGSTADMDGTLRPLYEANGVTAVLNGHDHLYERSLRNGINYFVLGGGGADLYGAGQSPNPYAVKSESTYHYGLFSYKAGSLSMTAFRPDGSVIETVPLYSPTARARALPAQEATLVSADADESAGGCGMGTDNESAAAGAGLLSLLFAGGLVFKRRRR